MRNVLLLAAWNACYTSAWPSTAIVGKTLKSTDFDEHSCSMVFIDAGANKGDTIQDFYAGRYHACTRNAGYRIERMPIDSFCVFSFEANPRWTHHLAHLVEQQGALGRRVTVFAETAVAETNGSVTFYQDMGTPRGEGASMMYSKPMKGNGEKRAITIPSINFASFVQFYTNLGALIMVKLDIEGAEFHVLRSLITTGQACKIDVMFIEWHDHKINMVYEHIPPSIQASLLWLLKAPGCRLKKVIRLDEYATGLDPAFCLSRKHDNHRS